MSSIPQGMPDIVGDNVAPTPAFEPYIAPETQMRELTILPVILGTLLGMVFGASSLYLVLKVGLTVSASIPVAVISLALFRLLVESSADATPPSSRTTSSRPPVRPASPSPSASASPCRRS